MTSFAAGELTSTIGRRKGESVVHDSASSGHMRRFFDSSRRVALPSTILRRAGELSLVGCNALFVPNVQIGNNPGTAGNARRPSLRCDSGPIPCYVKKLSIASATIIGASSAR